MRFFTRDKPKIKIQNVKRDRFSGWLKCTHCHELIHSNELSNNLHCCPKCNYHYRLNVASRLELLLDENSFEKMFEEVESQDPLQFVDQKPYHERISQAKEKSQSTEAITCGVGTIDSIPAAVGVMDFLFMGGSMGSAVGERFARLVEHAIEERLPVVTVASSGGARMQESALSLMQMAKTAQALGLLKKAKLPYISILTNPTSGGVTASFASLGDVIVAEPGALICFAGPRVIEQTIGEKIPEDAQKSEFLLEHGMIDCIVKRSELKEKIAQFLRILLKRTS